MLCHLTPKRVGRERDWYQEFGAYGNMIKVAHKPSSFHVSNMKAMETGPFEDVFPVQEWRLSIAILVYQRVKTTTTTTTTTTAATAATATTTTTRTSCTEYAKGLAKSDPCCGHRQVSELFGKPSDSHTGHVGNPI